MMPEFSPTMQDKKWFAVFENDLDEQEREAVLQSFAVMQNILDIMGIKELSTDIRSEAIVAAIARYVFERDRK